MPVTQISEMSTGILVDSADLSLVKFSIWGEPLPGVNSLRSWPNSVHDYDLVLFAPVT